MNTNNWYWVIGGLVGMAIAGQIGKKKREEAEQLYMQGAQEQWDKFAEDFRSDLAKQTAEKFGNR